jgi:hypothetical protein
MFTDALTPFLHCLLPVVLAQEGPVQAKPFPASPPPKSKWSKKTKRQGLSPSVIFNKPSKKLAQRSVNRTKYCDCGIRWE